MIKKAVAQCFIYVAIATMGLAVEAPGFKVAKKYPVPGDGGSDYIVFDNSSNRLYVSHGTEVNILDADSGTVLGKVEDTPGVHGIAIVSNLHRGFTTNRGMPLYRSLTQTHSKRLRRSVPKTPISLSTMQEQTSTGVPR